ncbi:MAG: exodeoxyribonuclease V subunit beta [bacterium]
MKKPVTPFDLLHAPLVGRNLIEASAGTGKTYTIEAIFLRLLLEKKMSVENILVVTFTEAATSELRERIRDKIHKAAKVFETGVGVDTEIEPVIQFLFESSPDSRQSLKELRDALARFDEAKIFTIHGFCHRVLLDHAFESRSRFDTEFIKDQRDLLSEIVQDFWRHQIYGCDENFAAYLLKNLGSPQQLIRKLVSILARPLNEIVTGLEPADLDMIRQSIETLFTGLSEIWADTRTDLEEILISHPGLAHNPYNKKNVPKWLAEMDTYLDSGNPFLAPKSLFRFSLETVSGSFNQKSAPPDHPVFHICQDLDPLLKSIGVRLEKKLIDTTREELKRRKAQRNLISFDDLLKNLRDALHGPSGPKLADQIRKKYHVALIDEFQDTDPVQFEIFRTVFSSDQHPVFFIGDPKQSIYNFRGADIFAYLSAQRETEQAYTLETNWRSDSDLVQAINTVFGFHQNPFLFQEIGFFPATGAEKNPDRGLILDGQPAVPFQLWVIDEDGKTVLKPVAQERVTKAVAGEIARLLNLSRQGKAVLTRGKNGEVVPLAPAHIAVLVRKHKEAEAMQQALRKLSVPSVLNTRASVFDAPEFAEMLILLQAVADPGSETRVRNALATGLMGVSGEEIDAYNSDDSSWEKVLEKFQTYRQYWSESGFYGMMRQFIRREAVRTRLLELEGGERKLTNLLHLIELLHEAETNNRFGMHGLLKWAEKNLLSPAGEIDEAEIRLETDADAVRLLTIHASKGLEFPIVFCPFSWGSAPVTQVFYHDPLNDNALSLDLGSPALETNREQAKKEILAEEIRLFYVALTRAKHRCYLVWGDINQTGDSAMAYLFHKGRPESEKIRSDLAELEKRAGGTLQLQTLPDILAENVAARQETVPELGCPVFKGFYKLDWGISSFSGLSSKTAVNVEFPDRDRQKGASPLNLRELRTDTPDTALTMFSMPGGAKTGNCFHELFEKLDFQETDPRSINQLVAETLQRYDFDTRWQPVALELVEKVLSLPLFPEEKPHSPFRLRDLALEERISEMEFYFPLGPVTSQGIADVLGSYRDLPSAQTLSRTLSRLSLNEIQGFMKGFIDLIFYHNGRYTIVDWKTNHLGDRADDYQPGVLQEYMIGHAFILQYVIYSVALHRWLGLNLHDYDFRKHFGGVFYFFLRGIQGDPEARLGIFREDMTGCGELIEDLSTYLGGGG